MDASVLDFSSVSNVIFLPFFFWECWKVGVRILYTEKNCAQHWLSSYGYCVLQQHIITLTAEGEQLLPLFFPSFHINCLFTRLNVLVLWLKSSGWICCPFCKPAILRWDSQTPTEVVEKPLVVFSFCALQIGAQVGFLFVLFLVLMEGIEKGRREGDLFCVCQWIISPLDFFVLTFFLYFIASSKVISSVL